MDCSTTRGDRHGSPSPKVDLVGIVLKGTNLVVTITDGHLSWNVECTPADIQSFAKLQAKAIIQCKIWIRHSSQEEQERSDRRVDLWNRAVIAAFERGGAAS